MSLDDTARERIERLRGPLTRIDPNALARRFEKRWGRPIVEDPMVREWVDHSGKGKPLGCLYAPFDWINDDADIVLVGITPGATQALDGLLSLRDQLLRGADADTAARHAKQVASFARDIRSNAARLMDRFRMHELFGLASCTELFGRAAGRVHYTSVLRYPVQVLGFEKKFSVETWSDYSGDDRLLAQPRLHGMITDLFEPEVARFPSAWIVPFGPVPALVLDHLARRGIVDPGRVLPGVVHPSGTQKNRHRCQLKLKGESHTTCHENVGCKTLQARTRALERTVARHIETRGVGT